ncbi:hypothetical protein ACWD8L_15250 [Streptomyces sp. NPDC005133]
MSLRSFVTKSTVAVAVGGTFLLSATPAQASSGWDYVGTTAFPADGQDYSRSGQALSTGGDVQFCISTGSSKFYDYDLWEYDPSNDDDFVTSVSGAGCWIVRGIGGYVDGDNNRAEFYIGTYDSSAVAVKWYD